MYVFFVFFILQTTIIPPPHTHTPPKAKTSEGDALESIKAWAKREPRKREAEIAKDIPLRRQNQHSSIPLTHRRSEPPSLFYFAISISKSWSYLII